MCYVLEDMSLSNREYPSVKWKITLYAAFQLVKGLIKVLAMEPVLMYVPETDKVPQNSQAINVYNMVLLEAPSTYLQRSQKWWIP